jgi:hypothetical protein
MNIFLLKMTTVNRIKVSNARGVCIVKSIYSEEPVFIFRNGYIRIKVREGEMAGTDFPNLKMEINRLLSEIKKLNDTTAIINILRFKIQDYASLGVPKAKSAKKLNLQIN